MLKKNTQPSNFKVFLGPHSNILKMKAHFENERTFWKWTHILKRKQTYKFQGFFRPQYSEMLKNKQLWVRKFSFQPSGHLGLKWDIDE